MLWHIRHIKIEPAGSADAPNPMYFKMALSAREDRDSHCTPGFKKRSKISKSWIWCTTQVLLAFFNTCQIDQCFSRILHFRGHHQCCVVRSCFIYELVTSTKLSFLSLQNSKCKYSPMPSEFQFKEPPLTLACMDIFWNCPILIISARLRSKEIVREAFRLPTI